MFLILHIHAHPYTQAESIRMERNASYGVPWRDTAVSSRPDRVSQDDVNSSRDSTVAGHDRLYTENPMHTSTNFKDD